MNAAAVLLVLVAAAVEEPVRVRLMMNGIPHDDVSVVIRAGDILIEPLPEVMRTTRGLAEVIAGRSFLSLRSLAPDVTYSFDDDDV
ncbi:MAG: hypothetical protein H7Z43_00785, partial [Clostridia bacterium]|nr:hypothetical protein [Deltaproteobacteria bacterium]